jgi:cytochrome c biogenesis protein CcmG, thiol:disulfide interchange protein DsbE
MPVTKTEPERRRFNPLILVPVILFAGFGLMFWLALNRTDPESLPSAMIGRPAPPLNLEPLQAGEPVPDQARLEAPGIKLLNFWASWCAPCRAEHPMLTEIARAGTPVYGVNYKDIPENALRFLDKLGNPFALVGADSGRTALDWGLYGVPETFVIDGQGKVLLRHAGPLTQRVFDEQVRPLLEAPPG